MVMLPYHRFADVAFLANTFPVFFFGVSSDTFLNFQTHSLNIALKSRLRIQKFLPSASISDRFPAVSSRVTLYLRNKFPKSCIKYFVAGIFTAI